MASSVTLHSANMVGTGNHVGPQAPIPSAQAPAHAQQPSAIRHKVCILLIDFHQLFS